MSRPDENYVDRFERRWALAVGAVSFVLPWLVVLTYNGNDSRLAWGERMVCLLWVLGALVGIACVIAGRRRRRIGRIGTAIIVGDALGALLFFISVVIWFVVGYALCDSCGE